MPPPAFVPGYTSQNPLPPPQQFAPPQYAPQQFAPPQQYAPQQYAPQQYAATVPQQQISKNVV